MPSSSAASQSLKREQQRRKAIRQNLTAWAIDAGFTPALHHRLLLAELQHLTRGGPDRLMVLMPPGSAKSTYASVLFPAWWFAQHPSSAIVAASHTADLAAHFGRQVRNLVLEHGPRLGYGLAADSRAAGRWHTDRHGSYFAAGVRGPITGRRADLAIIDDPVKSQLDADSARARDQIWDWYRSDLLTRLKPGGRIVLIMTRWHEDDLGGRLLSRHGSDWRVLRLPALAELNDPLGRAEGAPLWPEWEDAAALARKRATVGERAWAALFQQSPRPLSGGVFDVKPIAILDTPPPQAAGRSARAWDLAATAATGTADPDWTVGLKLHREPTGRFIVIDIVRLRAGPAEVEDAIAATARLDGAGVTIGIPEDPGSGGKTAALHITRRLAGHHVVRSRETGSKLNRALPAASQTGAGNLAIIRADWNHAFLAELRDFPFSSKDDQVDALSRAFAMLTDATAPARVIAASFTAR